MALSSSLRKVASKIVNKFGGDVTYRRVTTGSYNTTTGAITETESDTSIKGVLDAVQKMEINELVHETDQKLTIAASALANAPTVTDRVVISSVVYQIVKININEQDNTAISYDLFLRK